MYGNGMRRDNRKFFSNGAEHGVSSAKPFNACNYARNVPRSMTESLEILPPCTHTHTHRLVRNATNVRSFFVSADSVYTSKFTATTHATLSGDKHTQHMQLHEQ